MQRPNQRSAMSRVLAAITGIAITCLSTFVIFMTWFYIREEVFGNRDDLIAMMIQMIVCAGLLFVGCGVSIVKAFSRDKSQSHEQNEPSAVSGKNQRKQG
jgi:uncharacterized membrane protein YqgA involved in biofilm formation